MLLIIPILVFVIDRFTKILALNEFVPGLTLPVIRNVFHFTLTFNRGAAFGILKNQLFFLIAVTFLSIIFICVNLKKESKKPDRLAFLLILAGALGNLYDRIFFGYVIDFLDLRVWPVFNVADSAITIGALLLGYSVFREFVSVKKKHK
ncbi:MAG: signal peptidase II [Candidatus Omnitrophota bacterium]